MRQEAFVNPRLLKWARESINMDVEEASRKIQVRSERLRAWEDGERRPTVRQAREMARVYRRPLAAFYLPEQPANLGFSVPHDFRRLPHDQPRELSPELIAELRRTEYLRATAIELAEELSDVPTSFVGQAHLGESIIEVANRAASLLALPVSARQGWRTDYDALNAWKEAIESQGVLIMHLEHVETEEVRGIAIAERVFPLIAVNGKDSPYGRVFTLIHEFVHLMIGATGMSNLRISRRPRDQEQKIERFCNYVAGEVLVPRRELLEHRDVRNSRERMDWPDEIIARLGREFGTSREVVVRRLLILGKTSEAFYKAMRQQYARERAARKGAKGGPIPMPHRVVRAIGEPFARLALSAYHREAISASQLSELLGARLKHLAAVEHLLGIHSVLVGGNE